MCGRFALGIPKKRLEEIFSLPMPQEYEPTYNAAPGQACVAVSNRGARMLRWGLVPHWAKDAAMGARLINARSETVFDKPAFRDAVRTARCLIPAQAFYEWKQNDRIKTPCAIAIRNADVFAMAGIAARWQDAVSGDVVDSFAILTCAPNTLMKDIHDRMPVIVPQEAWSDWLAPSLAPDRIAALLRPVASKTMHAWPVSNAVNSPANNSRDLLEPVAIRSEKQGSLF